MAKEKKKDKETKKEETKDKKATKTKRAKSKTAEEAEQVEALDKAVKAREGEIVEKTPAKEGEEEAEEEAEELKEDKESSEKEAKVSEKEAEAPEEEEEELEIVEEKFYNLNLRKIWSSPREKRTPRAVRFLRDYISRHMKTDEVAISEEANSMLWQRGISKPPRKIRVRAVKDKDGRVIVFPGEVK